ncbi:glycoside hydrolase family 5 protein [Luteolibacter pohnpeiensis]|uniref:Endoglucanase n=1 Tax=Luteolibacter pohnpeiensis TaxID=454153 RepID=A0A934VVL7_9BACT|nr:glycoside hydrolase family 5 protein [Luteolibacter pohnpeiensis]
MGAPPLPYTGVSLSGAEFGSKRPGIYGKDYIYPSLKDASYFLEKGMNTLRVPFLWERLQPELEKDLDPAEIKRLRSLIEGITAKGGYAILDVHNYAKYRGSFIGSTEVPFTAFADLWQRLATEFGNDPHVFFGLMNEPHGLPTEQWRDAANAGIQAIRKTGAKNLILVCGNGFSGGHSWNSDWYGTPNAKVMLEIVDPADHFAFEIHQYLDSNFSGSSPKPVSATIGSEKLKGVTKWLHEHGKKGFLGEFGGANDPVSLAAIDDQLGFLDDHADVWLGWTWWAAGPWWGDDYFMLLRPAKDGQDRAQMAPLLKHVAPVSEGTH